MKNLDMSGNLTAASQLTQSHGSVRERSCRGKPFIGSYMIWDISVFNRLSWVSSHMFTDVPSQRVQYVEATGNAVFYIKFRKVGNKMQLL